MLHIILLILKIIGITLLALIGLLLLILLTILLVPIRYRVDASHADTINVQGNVIWLLNFIGARFTYLEGIFHIRIRILWFTLYDNLKPKPKKVRKKRHKTAKKKKKKKVQTKTSSSKIGKTRIQSDIKQRSIRKDSQIEGRKISTDRIQADKVLTDKVLTDKESTDKVQVDKIPADRIPDTEIRLKSEQKEITQQKIITDEKPISSLESTSERDKPIQNSSVENHISSRPSSAKKLSSERKEEVSIFQKILGKIKSIIRKITNVMSKIKNIKNKIISFMKEIKRKIAHLYKKLIETKNKIGLITDFIQNEMNKEGFHVTWKSLKKLLKHILPTRLKSRMIFGTGDPCSTGQVLGLVGILYSIYGDKVVIIPDFEHKRFEGEHHVRGRIRLITILIIVIRLILDKRFKQLKNNFQILKEAL